MAYQRVFSVLVFYWNTSCKHSMARWWETKGCGL